MIVIKKVIVAGGGHHGGSWKVALADFMTAMTAFFLVMWLLNSSEQTKKAVSDYFSTPSLIEYSFQNFGVEITLEKLFLDLVNEPMKAVQSFVEPMDKTPDLLDMGSAKVVAAFLADQLTDVAKNVSITPEGFDFDIPDYVLFERGKAKPAKDFVSVTDKLRGVTTGLKDSEVQITSALFVQSIPGGDQKTGELIAQERLDLVAKKVESGLEHSSTTVKGAVLVKEKKGEVDPSKLIGFIKVKVRQKPNSESGKKKRKLEAAVGGVEASKDVYQNFVEQVARRQEAQPSKDPNLKEKIEADLKDELPKNSLGD